MTAPARRMLRARRAELGLHESWFGDLRPPNPEPVSLRDSADLSHSADFTVDAATLSLERHDGGDPRLVGFRCQLNTGTGACSISYYSRPLGAALWADPLKLWQTRPLV